MQITVAELSQLLGGTFIGEGETPLHTVAKIEEGKPGALSFLSNPKYEEFIYTTLSSAVLVKKDFQPQSECKTALILVDDPYVAFTYLLEKFGDPLAHLRGIEEPSFIHEGASIGEEVYIGAFAYISEGAVIGKGCRIFPNVFIGKDVSIGDNCLIYPGVTIYHECKVGDRCIIHAGTVIGSDGFGFAPQADRSYKKIPQTGNVLIESDVEIGSNCSIDRATMGSTIIRKGVKIDNLVQIAHNVEIGEHTVMAGQSGVAGSSKLGKYIVMGGQSAIAGHLQIADGNQFGGQTGVMSSIHVENGKWFGSPSMDVKDSLRATAVYRKLPELLKRIEA